MLHVTRTARAARKARNAAEAASARRVPRPRPAPAEPRHASTLVLIVLLPQTNLLDAAGVAETLRIANEAGAAFDLRFVGPRARVKSSVGLALMGVAALPRRLPDGAMVVLLGARRTAEDFTLPEADTVVRWIARTFDPERHQIATVCGGALLAARAGLLNGRACTTHHALIERLAREAPAARVLQNRIFVQDGPVATSAGVTAGIDLALHLVASQADPRIAADTAREMVVYARRTGDDPQLSPWLAHRGHLHPAVHRVQDAVTRDPARDWTVAAMAMVAHVGNRHLARLFTEHAGVGPHEWLSRIRVELARLALVHGASSVERAAEAAGFGSAHALRRAWRRCREDTPSGVRAAADVRAGVDVA